MKHSWEYLGAKEAFRCSLCGLTVKGEPYDGGRGFLVVYDFPAPDDESPMRRPNLTNYSVFCPTVSPVVTSRTLKVGRPDFNT